MYWKMTGNQCQNFQRRYVLSVVRIWVSSAQDTSCSVAVVTSWSNGKHRARFARKVHIGLITLCSTSFGTYLLHITWYRTLSAKGCTVQCSLQPVKWYKTGRLNPIEHPTGTNIDGLEFNITSNSMCTSENKITYFLEVLATRQSHNSAFYCAAYENCIGCPETECKCGCVGLCYSRPAILKGNPVKLKMLYLDFSVGPSLVLLPFKSHIT